MWNASPQHTTPQEKCQKAPYPKRRVWLPLTARGHGKAISHNAYGAEYIENIFTRR